MSKEQKITNDIKAPNRDLEALRIHFPHCFDKDGNFQLEKFKNNLSEKEISFSTESYDLNWLGKSYARLLASDSATTLLKADETHNAKPENVNSENLLIKGDNLEVLKHLANAYYEQVKMIYIDPPYNTGSDGFVYEDDRKFTVKELQTLIGVDAEKAKRILDFTKQKSNSHSAWLTFLYPRLYIAKQLLKDDGVIFISIDDNEVAQLRLLMDEVFGEENFIAQFIWKRRQNVDSRAKDGASVDHEYILCYRESLNAQIRGADKDLNKYSNPDNDPRGDWMSADMTGLATADQRANLHYDLEDPKTGIIYKCPPTGWRYEPKRMKDLIANNEVLFPSKPEGRPRRKKFLNDLESEFTGFSTILNTVYNTQGTRQLRELFEGKEYFDFPKPTELIIEFVKQGTNGDADIVMDFFAGSGTTGHAVMQINTEDSGKRKFILVQIPEPIDPKKSKTAYDFIKDELKAEPTIFEITKERLIRAAKKTKEDLIAAKITEKEKEIRDLESKLDFEDKNEKIDQLDAEIKALQHQDLGFKIFETTPVWEDYNFEAEQFDTSQTLFDAGKLSVDDLKALLITWKTYDGIALTQELEKIDLSGYTAYYGSNKLYLMHKGFASESLKALLEKIDSDKHFEPKSIIAFGYHFESKNLREISENVKTYNNRKKKRH